MKKTILGVAGLGATLTLTLLLVFAVGAVGSNDEADKSRAP